MTNENKDLVLLVNDRREQKCSITSKGPTIKYLILLVTKI